MADCHRISIHAAAGSNHGDNHKTSFRTLTLLSLERKVNEDQPELIDFLFCPMSSTWASKLQGKLAALNQQSSAESIQALAKWIGFNRKHASTFAGVFAEQLEKETNNSTIQILTINVLDRVLVLEYAGTASVGGIEAASGDAVKWERYADLRKTLVEDGLLPILSKKGGGGLLPQTLDRLEDCIKTWDDANSLNGPLLLNRLKRQVKEARSGNDGETDTNEESREEPAPDTKKSSVSQGESGSDAKTGAPEINANRAESNGDKKAVEDDSSSLVDSSPVTPTPSTPQPLAVYDFSRHDKDIPAKIPTAPSEFLEPCRQIATLQITRDISNDGAVHLSSLLSGLPEDVRRVCAEAVEQELADDGQQKPVELTPEQARDFSIRVNSTLLDMDLKDQLQNVQAFREIVVRQRQYRKELLRLLIQSRCKFGADEAAQAFLEADRAKAELAKRKQILVDLMELEGLDIAEQQEHAGDNKQAIEVTLPPLTWYKPDGEKEEALTGDEPEAKKQRVD